MTTWKLATKGFRGCGENRSPPSLDTDNIHRKSMQNIEEMLGIFNRKHRIYNLGLYIYIITYIYNIHIYTYIYLESWIFFTWSHRRCFPRSPRCPAARWQMRRIVPCTRRSGHESCVVSRGFYGDVMGIYEIYWIYGIITVKSLLNVILFSHYHIYFMEIYWLFWIYGNIWFTIFLIIYGNTYIYIYMMF